MSLLVKITLAAALILSIVVPFGVFAGRKTKGRYKKALGINIFLFLATVAVSGILDMFSGEAVAVRPQPQRTA